MALEYTRHMAEDKAGEILETFKRHPIPTSLLALGLGSLVFELLRGGSGVAGKSMRLPGRGKPRARGASFYGSGEEAPDEYFSEGGVEHEEPEAIRRGGNGSGGIFKRLGDKLHLGDRTSHLTEDVRRRAHDVGDYARRSANQTKEKFQHAKDNVGKSFSDHPLAAGIIGLTVGMAAGFLIPQTREENRVMGRSRDRFFRKAKKAGQETFARAKKSALEKAEEAAEEIGSTIEKELM